MPRPNTTHVDPRSKTFTPTQIAAALPEDARGALVSELLLGLEEPSRRRGAARLAGSFAKSMGEDVLVGGAGWAFGVRAFAPCVLQLFFAAHSGAGSHLGALPPGVVRHSTSHTTQLNSTQPNSTQLN